MYRTYVSEQRTDSDQTRIFDDPFYESLTSIE
jgi:hypothetical protein